MSLPDTSITHLSKVYSADSLQNAPPESVAFRTDLDLAEMVAPLLEKLPVVNIKPVSPFANSRVVYALSASQAPKTDEAVDFHPKRPAVNNFVVRRKSLDKRPPPGKQVCAFLTHLLLSSPILCLGNTPEG